jgi:hypothetical protein
LAKWEQPQEALLALMQHFGCQRLRIVLSHHLVQMRLLPWRAELQSEEERQAVARHEFVSAYGAGAETWPMALSDEAPGRARISAALDQELLAALHQTAQRAGARLVSLEPLLVHAQARWGRQAMGRGCHWLLIHEPGRLCVVARQDGQWVWVRHARVADDWHLGLAQWLASEALLSGLDMPAQRVHVLAPALNEAALGELTEQGYRVLRGGWLA